MPSVQNQSTVAGRALAELTLVSLTRAIQADDQTLPAGTQGTIVGRYADGLGYEVEVFQPFHAVVTLSRDDVAE